MNEFPCDQKLTESQFCHTQASIKRKLKQNTERYGVHEGSPANKPITNKLAPVKKNTKTQTVTKPRQQALVHL